jgi:hypothetical protein
MDRAILQILGCCAVPGESRLRAASADKRKMKTAAFALDDGARTIDLQTGDG